MLRLKNYEMYPQLHFIVCGGDGSVCWILSVVDEMNFACQPTFSIIPLGTGNDLSISLNWGSVNFFVFLYACWNLLR